MPARSDASGMLHGTLDALILKTLTWGVRHGYGIARWLEEATDEAVPIEEGLALSRALPARAARPDRGRMGRLRAGTQGQVLSDHAEGAPPAGRRYPGVGALLRGGVEGADAGRSMTFGRRLRSRVWRATVEDEVDAELGFHVEMRARELEARGLSRQDARDAAIRRFGDINHVNATCRSIGRRRDRGMRRTEYLTELTQDLTFAARQLLHHPGFTIVALLTLSLGIGATAAIFSAVQAVVLRPIPVPSPSRILAVYTRLPAGPGQRVGRQLRGRHRAGVELHRDHGDPLFELQPRGHRRAAERIIGARVTAGFFDVFGVPPARGRVFTAAEDRPGGPERRRAEPSSLESPVRRRPGGDRLAGAARRPAVRGDRRDAAGVRLHRADRGALGADGLHGGAQGDARRAPVPGLRPPGARARRAERALAELHRNAESIRVRFPKEASEIDFAVTTVMDELVGDYRQPALDPARGGRARPADRLRQHRQPPAGTRQRRDRASWRFGRRSAPDAAGSSASC